AKARHRLKDREALIRTAVGVDSSDRGDGPRRPRARRTIREREISRHYADDGERLAVDLHGGAQRVASAAELFLPQTVRQDDEIPRRKAAARFAIVVHEEATAER